MQTQASGRRSKIWRKLEKDSRSKFTTWWRKIKCCETDGTWWMMQLLNEKLKINIEIKLPLQHTSVWSKNKEVHQEHLHFINRLPSKIQCILKISISNQHHTTNSWRAHPSKMMCAIGSERIYPCTIGRLIPPAGAIYFRIDSSFFIILVPILVIPTA